MWRGMAAFVGLVVVAGGVARAEPPARDIGAEARAVFAARCAACHGPDLPHPKGRFGYVLDLGRMAGNPELVIPSRPDESELWVLVSRGEMPPPDSPSGPVTAAEKEIVWGWIATGAPEPHTPAAGVPDSAAAPPPSSATSRTLRWVGKLHLLALHFPIALVIAAGVGELLAFARGRRWPSLAVQYCLMLAAAAAVPTVALGWLYAAFGGVGSPAILTAHRWLGTAAGAWLVVTAACAVRDTRRGVRSRDFRFALAAGVVLVVATAHAGGLTVHGCDFFDW